MKKLIASCIALLVCAVCTYGQANISKAEYFIDTDPGYGLAIDIPLTPDTEITNLQFTCSISNLSQGFHFLYVRAKNATGNWSNVNSRVFYKNSEIPIQASTIQKAEYFIDTDPGFGKATAIPMTPAAELTNVQFISDISDILPGFHFLYVRTQDANGNWSIVNSRMFYKSESLAQIPNIVSTEYYIDTDPGLGKAVNIPFTSGIDVAINSFTIDISNLTAGVHHIYVRAKSASGKWSMVSNKEFNTLTYLLVSANTLTIGAALNSTVSFDILSGINWTLTTDQPWLTPNKTSGSGNATVTLTAQANPNNATRKATVIVLGNNVTTQTISITQDVFTGISDISDQEITIYPNPMKDAFRLNGIKGKAILSISDINGKLLFTKEVEDKETVSMSSQPKGIYIVRITSAKGVVVRKLVKE